MKKGKAAPEKGRLVAITRLYERVDYGSLFVMLFTVYMMIAGGSSFYLVGIFVLPVFYSLFAFRCNNYSTYIRKQTIVVEYGPLPMPLVRPRPIAIADVKQIEGHFTSGSWRYSPSYTVQVKLKNGKTKILLFLPTFKKAQETARKLHHAWREEMDKLHFERKAGYTLNQVAENQTVNCARCGSAIADGESVPARRNDGSAALLCRDCATEVRSV